MANVKTLTLRLDESTWERYNDAKNAVGMTWDEILADWFTRNERGEFK